MTTPSDLRFTVAFTSVGRRCELVEAFRASIRDMGLEPRLIGIDASATAPALHFCDTAVRGPRVDDPGYLDFLRATIAEESVDLVVPLIDTELQLMARARDSLEALGATVLISEPGTVDICSDKALTYDFFVRGGIPTPVSAVPPAGVERLPWPVIVKPRRGSSSAHVYLCHTGQERDAAIALAPDPIVQQFATGVELTLDVLTDLEGRLIQVVTRERKATRSGESSMGVVIDRPDAVAYAARIVEHLDARGPITIQCFADGERLLFTEINCRLGGGFPLAYRAGADYPGLIVRMCRGEAVTRVRDGIRFGLAMSRYDRAVFFDWDTGTSGDSAWAPEGGCT